MFCCTPAQRLVRATGKIPGIVLRVPPGIIMVLMDLRQRRQIGIPGELSGLAENDVEKIAMEVLCRLVVYKRRRDC